MAPDVLSLPTLLEQLRAAEPPRGRVLSVLLDTSPTRQASRGYLLSFRDACKSLRAGLPAAESDLFEAAAAQAERFLTQDFAPAQPGLALFAGGAPDYFFAVPLPRRPSEAASWDERPQVEALQAALDDLERIAVLLFDSERARLFSIFLDQIEERQVIEDEVPGKQATGGWFGLAQTRYARHREDHLRRHAEHASAALLALYRRRPFDHLILAGPDEPLALLRQVLPRPLRIRLAGRLKAELFASETEVLAAARQEAQRIEREQELAQVRELVESASSTYVALGLDDTLAAANDGRLHLLLLAESFAESGSQCPNCGRLVPGSGPCPICGQASGPAGSLRERLIERALDQGASVEQVSGEAATLLGQYGGLGAWTRY